MQTCHSKSTMSNFISKEQYVRRFKKWNFSKNVTDVSWAIVSHKVQKRRLNGKDSMIYHKGKSVPDKKARKEMSRHARSVWDRFSNRGSYSIRRLFTGIRANQ